MPSRPYIPELADIVWLNFEPQSGKEIMKRRPAIVLTPEYFNKTTSLCFACPITSTVRNQPYEVEVQVNGKAGAILVHQMRSLDWKARKARFINKASNSVLAEVRDRMATLLFDDDVV